MRYRSAYLSIFKVKPASAGNRESQRLSSGLIGLLGHCCFNMTPS